MSAPDPIFELVESWRDNIASPEEGGKLKRILDNLRYLDRMKFQPFVPTLYSRHPIDFMERFHAWLTNPGLSWDQQRDLFELAHHIAFFSFDDFTALFQNAFSGPITRWCMSDAGILMDQPGWREKLDEERFNKTWYCPVTDSLLISVFHHVNEIEGKDRKPSFRDLVEFADENPVENKNKILRHIKEKGYERLVLLEDFVGTGTQSYKAVKWAIEKLPIPVLFCPMIIANEATERYLELQRNSASLQYPRKFSFFPAFELSEDCFVKHAGIERGSLFARVTKLAEELHRKLSLEEQRKNRGPLGFWNKHSPQKGTTAVMFSNTPNNSLPLIHHSTESWKPLFPRVARQPL